VTSPPLDVLPLALGAAASPMLLVGQMRTLTAPGSGVRRSWAYLAGNALVVVVWAPHPGGIRWCAPSGWGSP